MIEFLITMLLIVVIAYAIYLVIDFLHLPEPAKKLAMLVVAVVALLVLLRGLGLLNLRL